MTTTADDAKARVIKTIRNTIHDIEHALADGRTGYVFFWPEHCLAVRCLSEGQVTTGAANATIVKRNDPRTFTNGARQRAVLIDRRDALQRSLDHARKLLLVFEPA
jgi:ssDNA-binding replication factor A large subunit